MRKLQHDRLWALLQIGAGLGRRLWRPRKIDVQRKAHVSQSGRSFELVQWIDWIQHEGRDTRVRLVYKLEPRPRTLATSQQLLKAVRESGERSAQLSSSRNAVVVRRPIASTSEIDNAWKKVQGVFTGNTAKPRGRSNGKRKWTADELAGLLKRVLQAGPGRWNGTYANFRKVTRFSASGYEWDLRHEGLCNDWDTELSFIITSRSEIPYSGWRRLKRTGFVEELAFQLGKIGYRISMSARWGGGEVFMEFSKPVNIQRLSEDVRTHLAWSPRLPLVRRVDTPSPQLFLDGRIRIPKEPPRSPGRRRRS
jgi:hypothetical protein